MTKVGGMIFSARQFSKNEMLDSFFVIFLTAGNSAEKFFSKI